ncbi:hypothetical protein [Phenylobacterium sp.]|uniref:hypothetical protein n=1 Tax=Phenylobacterium sp. TaxID=1871053 RepID=UPI0026242EE0|nr:hypothetical protein [Phenylobacterium sp.]
MGHVPPFDSALLDFAETERQKEVIQLLIDGLSQRAVAKKVGIAKSRVDGIVQAVRKRASSLGRAPGHFNDGVAPGYRMGKVTVQRANGVVERVWERQHPEGSSPEEIMARCDERLQNFPRFAPVPMPAPATAPLTNFLGLFDLHIGEKISSDDPEGRWDIALAKATIKASVTHAISVAPKAKRIVVCFGGDAGHYDSLTPVTPKSRHVLHSDGDADDMVDAILDVAVFAIDKALATHEEVHVIWATGNHDEFSALWMRKLLARLYANEPRLSVVQSKFAFYALRFGKVMLCVHHGHGAKLTELAGKFAAIFREMWGQTVYAYAHAGHMHHIHEKEKDGLIATQHPSLAPSDDYALSKGLVSRRGCMLVTYHDAFGEVGRSTVRPEMLGVPPALEAA